MAQGETLLKDPVADLSESVARPEIENLGWSGITLAPGVTLGGLFEVSALYEKADEESSDINVDTVEFTLGAALREDLNTEVVFLWEEGEEKDIIIDSAVIEHTFAGARFRTTVSWLRELYECDDHGSFDARTG